MTQQRFSPGDRIRVLAEDRPGHVRTPGYIRGKMGRVERVLGEFKNPESLAHGGSGLPEKTLYRVSFRQTELWESYEGPADDALYVDVYEHWLEPAQEVANGRLENDRGATKGNDQTHEPELRSRSQQHER